MQPRMPIQGNNDGKGREMIDVYITCKNRSEAIKISNMLIKKNLIACANIFPIHSIYRWKGKIINEQEHAMIAKSISRHFEKIVEEVKAAHSYETPCIEKINAGANKEYLKWLEGEVA
jgi:periplasmic divalent cation tolerance protein